MTLKNNPTRKKTGRAELRHRAETKLKQGASGKPPVPMLEVDARRLLHELEVHQIELEMQNDELLQSHAALDAALKQYTDLYDFAPVGYFSLAPDGTIRQTNLRGADMLGMDRSKLINRRFGMFVSVFFRGIFSAFLKKTFESHEKGTCELTLQKAGQDSFWAYLEATCQDGLECQVVVVDINRRKQAEMVLQKEEAELESRVRERTRELAESNEQLRIEMAERKRAEGKLFLQNTQPKDT